MLKIDTPIQYVRGVGPKMAARLKKLGIVCVEDLLFYFPRDWDDLSNTILVEGLRVGNKYNIKAKILEISNNRTPRKRMNITSAVVQDENGGELRLVWFNQPFLTKNFHRNDSWIFSGKIEWDFQTKSKMMVSPIYEKNPSILSIYPETEGITSKYIRKIIKTVLDENLPIQEFLPDNLLKEEKLIDLNEAIRKIHFPINQNDLSKAKKRLAFDELFLIVLRMMTVKKELAAQCAPMLETKIKILVEFTKELPYKLTDAQRKSSWEILKDLSKNIPMNRLLQGDVGSGKTVVACTAALNAIKNGYQTVWMAPTEILAGQHFENVSKLFENFGVKIALITGSRIINSKLKTQISKLKTKTKNLKIKDNVLNSDLIIGTHALIQEGVEFKKIGLVIIDEQHRFGVKQRAFLAKASSSKLIPHFLSMTATPIPRTLALSLYGDLDISVIDEMPPGRKKVVTKLVDPVNRDKAYQFMQTQIKNGSQVFVICPLIETKNEKLKTKNLFEAERKSVIKEYDKLSKQIFPDLSVGMLHGKMKPKEKEKIMSDFKNKKIDILVSTSVIEVGMDIPNATIMMIEDSDRFGLAQLHQFRGRVGRGQKQSYCLLFTNSLSPETNRRLNALVACSDGFKLAEKDMEIRGPGELAGAIQHGLPDLKMASLTDIILVNQARKVADKIIASGLDKYQYIQKKLNDFELAHHLE